MNLFGVGERIECMQRRVSEVGVVSNSVTQGEEG
jgi:hypothetical protein